MKEGKSQWAAIQSISQKLGCTLGRERSVSLGNGRTETRDYDEGSGYLSIATSGAVQDLEFTYDEVGNVLTRFDDLIDKTETFSYDALNRLATSQVTGQSTVSIAYSAAGRITSKSDVGSYTYGAGAAGPFAVTSANGLSYTYDANGRMITRGSDDITWYSYDLPKKIEKGTKTTEFWYGPDRARYRQELRTSGGLDAVIRYVGTLFEFEDPVAGSDVYRHYVHAGSRVVAMVERVGTTNTKHFPHRDHQGSVTKVTNAAGSVIQSLAYDAWGLRRNATDWSALGSPFAGTHEMERGYTGHEHLDTVGLIHMNGRVQDPILGRFISADPFVQAPYNTQSHNRYSYVWNNPASMIDPSGFNKCDPKNLAECTEEEREQLKCQHFGEGCGYPTSLDPHRMPGVSIYRGNPFADNNRAATNVPNGSQSGVVVAQGRVGSPASAPPGALNTTNYATAREAAVAAIQAVRNHPDFADSRRPHEVYSRVERIPGKGYGYAEPLSFPCSASATGCSAEIPTGGSRGIFVIHSHPAGQGWTQSPSQCNRGCDFDSLYALNVDRANDGYTALRGIFVPQSGRAVEYQEIRVLQFKFTRRGEMKMKKPLRFDLLLPFE